MTGGAMKVLTAGPFSSLQDAGRTGWQRFGVSVAGAFDHLYLAAANSLVGNAPDEAAIEFTLRGDSYEMDVEDCLVAVVGDFDVLVDGAAASSFRSFRLRRGQVLTIGAARRDARGYLSVAGGFAVTPVLGSRSTHIRTRLGGIAGRTLQAGDRLPLRAEGRSPGRELAFDQAAFPASGEEVRVVLGPQDDFFTAEAIGTLLQSTYRVSARTDRMGCRLEGPKLEHARGFNIVSDAIPLGAVQVPGAGEPIVLLADRQTTGGYPKIATVVLPDIRRFAQARPGDAIRFSAVTPEQARAIHLGYLQLRRSLPGLAAPAAPERPFDSERLLGLNLIDGVVDMRNGDIR